MFSRESCKNVRTCETGTASTYLAAFEEAQPVDVILDVLPELLLDGCPRVAKAVHLLGTIQLHGRETLGRRRKKKKTQRAVHQQPAWLYALRNYACIRVH